MSEQEFIEIWYRVTFPPVAAIFVILFSFGLAKLIFKWIK